MPTMSGSTNDKEQTMSNNDEYGEAGEPPGPDPALKRLERFVGTWTIRGRTLDADHDDVFGTTTFHWQPGGFFLQQHIELDFAGLQIRGLEVIGYDPATGKFPSTVFSNLVGLPSPTNTTSRTIT
jgi:hypothetical protein